MFKALRKKFRYGEKGFTLIELLVVVAILGALAAVVVPNVGRFIGEGETQAQQTELHNIQTAVMAMMAEASVGAIEAAGAFPYTSDDMDNITVNSGAVLLSTYITGLESDGTTASGCTYTFTSDGQVSLGACP
jgi:type IV pilus assembly protein PilA